MNSAAASLTGRHVTVIGAGIVGVVAASFLQRAGYGVTVLDSGEPGRGCSYGNGGAISPDFCIPMAMPGMLRKVPRWLLDPDGPLVVRWSYLPKIVPWLLRWAQASRTDNVLRNAAAMRILHLRALEEYRDLLGASAAGLIDVTGQAHVYRAEVKVPGGELARAIREQYGIDASLLNAQDVRGLDPNLSNIFHSGLYFPANGHTTNPHRLVTTLARQVVEAGGEVVREKVLDIEAGADGPVAVVTEAGRRAVDILVVAAGMGSLELAARLGDRVPLAGERGYHVMLPSPGVVPPIKISDRDRMFGLTPMEGGLRISGTAEFDRPDAPMNDKRARSLLKLAKIMYPRLDDTGAQFWMGVRPSTPDSLPVIGRSSRFANAFYAFGHGHFGLTGAPTTGRLLADIVSGREPVIDPIPYRVQRFDRTQKGTLQ